MWSNHRRFIDLELYCCAELPIRYAGDFYPASMILVPIMNFSLDNEASDGNGITTSGAVKPGAYSRITRLTLIIQFYLRNLRS